MQSRKAPQTCKVNGWRTLVLLAEALDLFAFVLAPRMPFVSHLGTMKNAPIKDGGPALPMQDAGAIHAYASARMAGLTGEERDRAYVKAKVDAFGGMSLRDWFAGQALAGMLACGADSTKHNPPPESESKYYRRMFAEQSYRTADAMIAAREGGAK
jgi:hypothetical protein